MQSCMTLEDFLPRFGLPTIRWANAHKEGIEAVEVIGHLIAIRRALSALEPAESPDPDAP